MSTFTTPSHWKIFGKPSRRELAHEIDRLNAALSDRQTTIEVVEHRWRAADDDAHSLALLTKQLSDRLTAYDEEALAEARRLAVLQVFGGYAHNLNEAAQWLATGTWTATEKLSESEWLGDLDIAPQMIPAGDDGPEPEIGTTTAYAHGYVKGWNTLLNKIQSRLRDKTLPWPDDQFEHLRHSFTRSEAM